MIKNQKKLLVPNAKALLFVHTTLLAGVVNTFWNRKLQNTLKNTTQDVYAKLV